MKKREANFGIVFRHWHRANKEKFYSSAFELKQTSTNSIPFSCLEKNQIIWLQAISSDKGAYMRIQGTNGEPDYIYMRNAPSYVVIKYPCAFYVININNFIAEKKRSKSKSLTEERAEDICLIDVQL